MDPLAPFSAATRGWFERTFAAPTPAQAQGWPAIAGGSHVLIQAPTGSGKTLTAFLYAIDRLNETPGQGLRVLYVSPLKALNYDIERNLRGPLAGLESNLRVAVRTGDTPQKERRALLKDPPDILITTPESLYLLLTSQARETLRGVETLILDEVHAVAGTKRGAHLAISVERLEALCRTPPQRIGLSATQRPLEEVGKFVSGAREITLVDAGTRKELDLEVVIPVEDLRELGQTVAYANPPEADGSALLTSTEGGTNSIWPSIYPEILRRRAPLDDRLREQPPSRRAARAAAERAREPGHRPRPAATRDRARPPRLAGARAAPDRRGGAEGWTHPVPRRDLEPRARHRHGSRRPGDPGRVAEVGGARPAAHRPRRA
jgi:ATP-dependent Lhr-like helicase